MASVTLLDPSVLVAGAASDDKLKETLVTELYVSGAPAEANQVCVGLLDASGQLKPGLLSGSTLKPGIAKVVIESQLGVYSFTGSTQSGDLSFVGSTQSGTLSKA